MSALSYSLGLRYGLPCLLSVNRPPVEDINSFLTAEGWIMRNMFEGKDIRKVAHGLAGDVEAYLLCRPNHDNDTV